MNITLTEVYIVVWELFVFNNFCELKFCTGKFSYKSICKLSRQHFVASKNFFSFYWKGTGLDGGVRKRLLYLRLPCIQKDMVENSCHRYAVCGKRSEVIIGHLQRKLSSLFAVFKA